MTDFACVVEAQNLLGEGPVWDEAGRALYWVDIEGCRLQRYRPADGRVDDWRLPAMPGAVAPRASGGVILALASGLVGLDPETGDLEWLVDLEADVPGNRANDGKVDRRGRFWVGTMDAAAAARTGALYRCDPDGRVHRILTGLGIPNTLAWSPDGATMYFAETLDRTIHAYDFDAASGTLGNRRVFATTAGEAALPDGSTIDAEGCLWNAQWDGWRVVRYAPDGSIDRIVAMPVQRPTSCMFGGPDLTTMYVTSARTGLSPAELADQPWAGGLFALDAGVAGLPETPYAG